MDFSDSDEEPPSAFMLRNRNMMKFLSKEKAKGSEEYLYRTFTSSMPYLPLNSNSKILLGITLHLSFYLLDAERQELLFSLHMR